MRVFFIHPIIFAIFPILFLYKHNVDRLSPEVVIVPLIVSISATVVCWLVLTLLLKDVRRAGILTSVLLIMLFSYGHVRDLLIDSFIVIGNNEISPNRFFFPIWALFILVVGYATIRTQKNLTKISTLFNLVALALIAFLSISKLFIVLNLSAHNSYNVSDNNKIVLSEQGKIIKKPCIYYIILDGYARADILKELYNFDNSEFIAALNKRGFYVADESRSNYMTTALTFASTLNMEYLNYLTDILGEDSALQHMTYRMIVNNKVVRIFQSKGYQFVLFGSGWEATTNSKYANISIKCGKLDEFLMLVVNKTMLQPLLKPLIQGDAQQRILCTFAKLADIFQTEAPKFVLAHIISPHYPYFFGESGPLYSIEYIDENKTNVWRKKEKYLGQLQLINKKTIELLDQILSKEKQPPIIILQSDHGTGSLFSDSFLGYDGELTPAAVRERTGILNAYYLPGFPYENLYKSITPVNSFRVIFNYYFEADYKLLDDKSYYSNYAKPYRFTDVTEHLRSK